MSSDIVDKQWVQLCERVALDAIHDSPARSPHPKCLSGTRRRLLDEIDKTFRGSEQKLTFVSGPSGSGKSAVAFTVAESQQLDERNLVATFFFSRQHTASHLIPTISYQLGLRDHSTKAELCKCIADNPTVSSPCSGALLNAGLSQLEDHNEVEWIFVIVDGIHECDNDEGEKLLHLLTKAARDYRKLRILLTSRPVPKISRLFEDNPVLYNCILDLRCFDTEDDVRHILKQSFKELYQDFGLRTRKPWPTEQQLDGILHKTGGSFFVSTALIRFVEESDDPEDALRRILDTAGSGMDGVYLHIFRTLGDVRTNLIYLRIFIGLLQEPIAEATLARLFNQDIHVALGDLASLVTFCNEGTHVQLHHSLDEFLVDWHRCGDQFYIEPAQTNAFLAQRCCEIIEEALADPRNPRIYLEGSSVLLYPSRHWITHFLRAEPNDHLHRQLEHFIEKSFSGWISAISHSCHSGSLWTSGSIHDMYRDFSKEMEELVHRYERLSEIAKSRLVSLDDYALGPEIGSGGTRDPQDSITRTKERIDATSGPVTVSKSYNGWFLTALRNLVDSSGSGYEIRSEEELKDEILAMAVSEPVPHHNPNDPKSHLTFRKSPHDLTQWIKGKGLYPFDSSGVFSDIWRCVLDQPGGSLKTVAVKAFRSAEPDGKVVKRLHEEVRVWVRLNHPNVLPLYGTVSGFTPLPALVSPWVEHGSLSKYLLGFGKGLSKGGRVSLLVKVAEALEYIHSDWLVVHGILTGSNILIDSNGEPLISDFGLSSIIRGFNGTSYLTPCAPYALRWTAPELFGINGAGPSPDPNICTDIYSFGCVMLHVLSGRLPYYNVTDNFVLVLKVRGELPQRPLDLPIEESAWGVIEACLNSSDKCRPSLHDIIRFLRELLHVA